MGNEVRIFISHYPDQDRDIATFLKNWIESQTSECTIKVFLSSSGSIPPGSFYQSEIHNALIAANLTISLLSSEAAKRPWMIFEIGFELGRNCKVLPILCRQAKIDDIPTPLNTLQLIKAEDASAFKEGLAGLFEYVKPEGEAVERLRTKLNEKASIKCQDDDDNSWSDELDHNEWSHNRKGFEELQEAVK